MKETSKNNRSYENEYTSEKSAGEGRREKSQKNAKSQSSKRS